jgi:hypothetical protein
MEIKWIGKLHDGKIVIENNQIPGLELKPVIDATGMPSKEEMKRALEVINAVAHISAIHGMWTEPVPEVIKTLGWLKSLAAD